MLFPDNLPDVFEMLQLNSRTTAAPPVYSEERQDSFTSHQQGSGTFSKSHGKYHFSFRGKNFSGTTHVSLLHGKNSCEFAGRSLVVLPI